MQNGLVLPQQVRFDIQHLEFNNKTGSIPNLAGPVAVGLPNGMNIFGGETIRLAVARSVYAHFLGKHETQTEAARSALIAADVLIEMESQDRVEKQKQAGG